MPQTALRLLQRCNNAPFVFHFAERRTLALIPADGSNCKALKIRYYMVSAPSRPPICFEPRRIATLHLFCFCFFQSERSLSQQAPALHIRFLFPPKYGTFRNAPYPSATQNTCSLVLSCLSKAPISPKFRSHAYPSPDALTHLMAMSSPGSKYPWSGNPFMGNSGAGLEAKLRSRLELRAIIISLSLSLSLTLSLIMV